MPAVTYRRLDPSERTRVEAEVPFTYTTQAVYRLSAGDGLKFGFERVALDAPRQVRHNYRLFGAHAGPSTVVVAEHGDRAVGVVEYSHQAWHHLVRVWNLFVHPQYRRQGIGSELLAHGWRRVQHLAARGLYLETQASNAPALAFYRAQGLDLWGFCDFWYSNRDREQDQVCLWLGRVNPAAVPTQAECRRLLGQYGLAEGIVEHLELTARVAALLGAELTRAGVPVNVRLVTAGALLHDIGKAVDGSGHHRASRRILEEEGYPVLGPVVERHLTDLILTPEAPTSWEERLVFYADKVCTCRVVSLRDRFEDLCSRYPAHAATFRRALSPAVALEDAIFAHVPWDRRDLAARVLEAGESALQFGGQVPFGTGGDVQPELGGTAGTGQG